MKRSIKSYLVFTPFFYKIIMLFILPVLLVGLQVWWMHPATFVSSAFIVIQVYLYLEIFLDMWVFGGIAAKGAGQPEYLKSSKRGMKMMQNALTVSVIKPFLMIFAIVGVGSALGISRRAAEFQENALGADAVGMCLAMLFAAGFLITVSTLLMRFLEGKMVSICVCGGAGLIFASVYFALERYWVGILWASILLAAASVVFGIKIVMWRIKESYYDKRN